MSDAVLKNISSFNNDPVLHATWLYYQEALSQTEVAKLMGVSRVTVVKYLQTARKRLSTDKFRLRYFFFSRNVTAYQK